LKEPDIRLSRLCNPFDERDRIYVKSPFYISLQFKAFSPGLSSGFPQLGLVFPSLATKNLGIQAVCGKLGSLGSKLES